MELTNNTILIVDDQESIIKSLKRLLLSEPYNIISAQDGETALKIIKEHKDTINIKDEPDKEEYNKKRSNNQSNIFLIISDQRMPNMTGTQFLEKSVELLPDTIRFILSGYADRDEILKALNKGIAHRYLTKPWNNEELLIIIRQAHESPEKVRRFINSNDSKQLPEINIMDMEIRKFDEHRKDMFLGRVAVHHGFITQEDLDTSFTLMQSERQAGRSISLENILFERGFISSEDVSKIVAVTKRRMGKTFAKTAIQNFGVSQADIEKGLIIQAKEFSNTSTCRLLGDILVAEKIITEEQKESIIIDQIYSEKELLDSDKHVEKIGSILKRRKKRFFYQRALDKVFGKSAINRNFATESEILKALDVQLIHFTKTSEIKLIKDILIEHSIISQSQAQTIQDAIFQTQHTESNPKTNLSKDEQALSNADSDIGHVDSIIKKADLDNTINVDEIIKIEPVDLKNGDAAEEKDIKNIELFRVNISKDELEATLETVGTVPENINADSLKEILTTKYQIIYGVVDDVAIELFLRQSGVKKDNSLTSPQDINIKNSNFVIARGKSVKLGRNGIIKYYFESEYKHFGKELASGKFDYRDRGEIPNVTKGTLLAEKIPPIPAVNGITVKGIEISAPIPIDVNFDCGQGVEISQDGLQAKASADGRPDITLTGKISVLPEKLIKGNVDFRTGNVKFSGDIVVQGTILPGFSVTGGNLTVNDIEEADVNITNTVSVKNNINSSLIKTGILLTAQVIKKSKIIAQGDVIVQKEIIDSTIITSGRVIVPRGRILASTIHAAKGIEAMNIGSEVSLPCHLFPGSDDHAKDILRNFAEKIDRYKEQLVKLEAVQKQYNNQSLKQLNDLSELSRLQEKIAIERRKSLEDKKSAASTIVKKQMEQFLSDLDKRALKMDEAVNSLFDKNDILQTKTAEVKAKIKAVRTQMQSLLKEKNSFKTWYEAQKEEAGQKGISVSVQGTIFAGTHINSINSAMVVKSNIKNSKIQEITNTNDPNNQFQELAVFPLSSRGKPHVFRV